jgi:hypothetical protein
MAFPTLVQAAIDRLASFYNGNDYDAAGNPGGMANDGHRINFEPSLKDIATAGGGVSDFLVAIAADVEADATAAGAGAEDAETARAATVAARDKAQLWASAPEDTEVEPGLFSARHGAAKAVQEAERAEEEADRAAGLAAGLNLPALSVGDAGKYARVNVGGTGYELGELLIATVAEIKSKTGTGLANAQTLGTILDELEVADAASAAVAPPIGAYMLWPWYASAPDDKWLEAKGQIVSLAAYPGLASVLPNIPLALYNGNPAFTPVGPLASGPPSGGSGATSPVQALVRSGRRIAIIQSGYARFIDRSRNIDIQGAATADQVPQLANSYRQRPIMRDNDEIAFLSSAGLPSLLNLATLGTTPPAQSVAGTGGIFQGASAAGAESSIWKLPNGVLVSFVWIGTEARYVCAKLASGAGSASWAAFFPAGVSYIQTDLRIWQLKNGTLFMVARPAQTTGDWTIYKTTDGNSWVSLGAVSSSASIVGLGGPFNDVDGGIDRDARLINNVEQSPDGQQAVVRLANAGWLISTNGGGSFTFKPVTDLLTGLYAQFGASSIGFIYDVIRSRWLLVSITAKSAAPTARHFSVWASTDLSVFTLAHEIAALPALSGQMSAVALFAGTNKISALPTMNNGNQARYELNLTTLAVTVATSIIGSNAFYYRLEGYQFFDGAIFSGPGSASTTAWVPNSDDTPVLAISNTSSDAFRDFVANSADGMVGNFTLGNADASGTKVFYGAYFEYNQNTERKLPSIEVQNISSSPAVRELYKPYVDVNSYKPPRVYMRVK